MAAEDNRGAWLELIDMTQPARETFTNLLAQFSGLNAAIQADFINYIVLNSENQVGNATESLEAQLYSFIHENYRDDERFEFVKTEVAGQEIEFILIKSLTKVMDFSTPIIPFLRKNPSTTYTGFHDTTNYAAEIIAAKGVEDPFFDSNGFHLHAMWLQKESNWDVLLLSRLAHYGKSRNNPLAEPTGRQIKSYPPKEVRERDARSARVAFILPTSVLLDKYKDEVINFTEKDRISTELRIHVPIPPACCAITNVYHELRAFSELVAMGFGGNSPAIDDELRRIKAHYKFYGFSEVTGKIEE